MRFPHKDEEKSQDFSQKTDTTNTTPQGSATKKKRSDPKDPENPPPQTTVHYNLRLPQSSSSAEFPVTSWK